MIIRLFDKAKAGLACGYVDEGFVEDYLDKARAEIDAYHRENKTPAGDDKAFSSLVKSLVKTALVLSALDERVVVDYGKSIHFLQTIRNETRNIGLAGQMGRWIQIVRKIEDESYSGFGHAELADFFCERLLNVRREDHRVYWKTKLCFLWDHAISKNASFHDAFSEMKGPRYLKNYEAFEEVLRIKGRVDPCDLTKKDLLVCLDECALRYAMPYLEALKVEDFDQAQVVPNLINIYEHSAEYYAGGQPQSLYKTQAKLCMEDVAGFFMDRKRFNDLDRDCFQYKLQDMKAEYKNSGAYALITDHYIKTSGVLRGTSYCCLVGSPEYLKISNGPK